MTVCGADMARRYIKDWRSEAAKGAIKSVSAAFDCKEVLDALERIPDQSRKAVNMTIQDVRQRAPGWISKAVREEYNIKKADFDRKDKKKVVDVRVSGSYEQGFEGLTITYTGRVLTPIHFDMKPTVRPMPVWRPAGDDYPISVKIFKKGGRERIHGKPGVWKPFLGRAHASEKTKAGGAMPSIVFHRVIDGGRPVPRKPIHPYKTLSVPQMIQDGKGVVKPGVRRALNDNIEKRFNHHLERFVKF